MSPQRGDAQFLSAPDGTPLWVSDVEPGSVPDITAARIRVPAHRPTGESEQALHAGTRPTNTLIRDPRALGERAAAELKERRRTLKHVPRPPPDRRHRRRRTRPQRNPEMITVEKTSLPAEP